MSCSVKGSRVDERLQYPTMTFFLLFHYSDAGYAVTGTEVRTTFVTYDELGAIEVISGASFVSYSTTTSSSTGV